MFVPKHSLKAGILGLSVLLALVPAQALLSEEVGSALAADDVCAGGLADEACALNAIQLRGAKVETQGVVGLEDEDGGLSEALEAALLAVQSQTRKPDVSQRNDLTEQEAANLTSQLNQTQLELRNLTVRINGFWKRVNATTEAIGVNADPALEETGERRLSSHAATGTQSSRPRSKGAAPLHAKLVQQLTSAQEDLDSLWTSIQDLRYQNEANRHFMDNHRHLLLSEADKFDKWDKRHHKPGNGKRPAAAAVTTTPTIPPTTTTVAATTLAAQAEVAATTSALAGDSATTPLEVKEVVTTSELLKEAATTPELLKEAAATTPELLKEAAATTPQLLKEAAATTPEPLKEAAVTTPGLLKELKEAGTTLAAAEVALTTASPAEEETKTSGRPKKRKLARATTAAPEELELKTTGPRRKLAMEEDPEAYPGLKDDVLELVKLQKGVVELAGQLDSVDAEIAHVERVAERYLAA